MSHEKFLSAARRENTQKTYESGIRHFELTWQGRLPATPSSIIQYLSHYANDLTHSTLSNRLAAISDWHKRFGFADPTNNFEVRQTLKGIGRIHGKSPKKAKPTEIGEIAAVYEHLESIIDDIDSSHCEKLRASRDLAIFTIMFWKALRPNELVNITMEEFQVKPEGIEFHLSETKNYSHTTGRTFVIPALNELCPVRAARQWLSISHVSEGHLFRKIDRHGNVAKNGLWPNSLSKIFNRRFLECNISKRSAYTFRRGFATWAAKNGWTVTALKEYVGWKDGKSAERYIDMNTNMFRDAINSGISMSVDLEQPLKNLDQDQFPKRK